MLGWQLLACHRSLLPIRLSSLLQIFPKVQLHGTVCHHDLHWVSKCWSCSAHQVLKDSLLHCPDCHQVAMPENKPWSSPAVVLILSQNQGWKGPQASRSSNPLPHTGPPTSPFNTSPGCPGPHPTGLEHLRDGRGIHSLSGQLFQHLTALSVKNFPDIQPQSSLPLLETISPRPAVTHPSKE